MRTCKELSFTFTPTAANYQWLKELGGYDDIDWDKEIYRVSEVKDGTVTTLALFKDMKDAELFVRNRGSNEL
jgi:hypothetical protein